MALKLRRGTSQERSSIVFEEGELIYDTDSKQLYAGDGATAGGTLVSYNGSVGGNMGSDLDLNGNNIVGQGDINITGSITSTGNITTDGNIIMKGSITLGDGDVGDTIDFDGVVKSDILPQTTNTYNIGAMNQRWEAIYSNSVYADTFEGNVVAQDSSLLVDYHAGVLRGTLQGTVVNANPGELAVQGNVTGDVTGTLTGSINAGNGAQILDNGSDGTDAVFTGYVDGTVKDGVTSTQTYFNPPWIGNLDASKLFGVMNGVEFIGDVRGNVLADDSTLLVDGVAGVLRGPHFGDVDTGTIAISNVIETSTNSNLIIRPNGTGFTDIQSAVTITAEQADTPLNITSDINTSSPVTIFSAFDLADVEGTSISIVRGRGDTVNPTALQANDIIGFIGFSGHYDATSTATAGGIIAQAESVDAVNGRVPGKIGILVNKANGDQVNPLSVNSDGGVQVNTTELVAGANPGEVDDSTPATYVTININGTDYAIPAYAIRP